MSNANDIASRLAAQGLRLASQSEAGWYYVAIVDGVRRSFWVTDVQA